MPLAMNLSCPRKEFQVPSFRASPASLPRIPVFTGTGPIGVGRDPWFDGLTTLSEVEGESRKIAKNQIILDPGSPCCIVLCALARGEIQQGEHPASVFAEASPDRPRDLAGRTNRDKASSGGVALRWRQRQMGLKRIKCDLLITLEPFLWLKSLKKQRGIGASKSE
jgi:hypothetical protein